MVGLGDSHHVADDGEGERCRDLFHEVALTVREALEQVGHQFLGPILHLLFDAGDLLGGEAARDDVAQAEVLRVVHVDHRTEELVHLDRKVTDVGALAAAEQLRVAADVPDVVVTRHGAIAGAGRERSVLDHPFLEELERRFVS